MTRWLGACVVLFVAGWTLPAHARGPYTYNYFKCSNVQTVTHTASEGARFLGTNELLYVMREDFPVGADRDQALESAVGLWNVAPQNFFFTLTEDASLKRDINNKFSQVYYDRTLASGTALAVTYVKGTCSGGIVGADVVVNPDKALTASSVAGNILYYGGSQVSLIAVLLHELGHALGLKHNNLYANVMGLSYQYMIAQGPFAITHVGGYGARAAALLYGYFGPSIQDLQVSHWRRTGTQGEYSTHGKTILLNTGGVEPPLTTACGPQAYSVRPGDLVRPGFSFENAGNDPQSGVLVSYYLSTDKNIALADRLISETRIDIPRGPADDRTSTFESNGAPLSGETYLNVSIPTDASLGLYYMGVIVDRMNQISETNDTTSERQDMTVHTFNRTYLDRPLCIN